eukprot:evm.model.scf_2229EXC.3 EVM.evm.TU.scf_2229EXC.3   scf_2229EXC:8853-14112(-)
MSKNYLGDLLKEPPRDGVTSVRFSKTSDLLLVASWDASTRLYDAETNVHHGTFNHRAPVMDCTFQEDYVAFIGGLDGQVKRQDFYRRADVLLGTHHKPVKCVEYLKEHGLVASAGWDKMLHLWDPRLPQFQNCVTSISLPGKAYTMSQTHTKLVVGTSERKVRIYDIRSVHSGRAEQHRESSLRHQTRCIRCFPDGTGYGLSSIEGRVAMEYFDLGKEAQEKQYAFKCHRKKDGVKEIVYPVNALAFHPSHGTFATGGCDGIVSVWDGENKKRLSQISGYPTSIAVMDFSRDGHLLAVAASYTFEMGDMSHPEDGVYVRRMQDTEVKPKPRKQL